jgi:competence protein ComEA
VFDWRELSRRHWRSVAAGGLLLAATVGVLQALLPRPPEPLAAVGPSPSPRPAVALPPVVVHVVGAVETPGVYSLPAGSRARDAIDRAGGLGAEADPASLNLAAVLIDGQQVVVRSRQQTGLAGAGGLTTDEPALLASDGGRLNLNLASQAELDALPGIGAVYAQRIVERRQRHGPFTAIEQLRDEKLIPGAVFERLKDRLAVN